MSVRLEDVRKTYNFLELTQDHLDEIGNLSREVGVDMDTLFVCLEGVMIQTSILPAADPSFSSVFALFLNTARRKYKQRKVPSSSNSVRPLVSQGRGGRRMMMTTTSLKREDDVRSPPKTPTQIISVLSPSTVLAQGVMSPFSPGRREIRDSWNGEISNECHDETLVEIRVVPAHGSNTLRSLHSLKEFSYMRNRLDSRANFFRNQMADLGRDIVLSNDSEDEDVYSVTLQRQDTGLYLGRIACENKVGKWNSECVLLEGNFESSLGESVKLNVRDLPWLSIFPGQIVGVVGSNPSGREIRASKMLFPSVPPRLNSNLDDNIPSTSFSMFFAVGPFGSFADLTLLLDSAIDHHVSVIVLMGPFLDVDSKLWNDADIMFDDAFQLLCDNILLARIRDSPSHSRPKLILLPSLGDIHHDPVYPQPPFSVSSDELCTLSNPSSFYVNNLLFYGTSLDILFHLSTSELSSGTSDLFPSDRLGKFIRHILTQRSVYPLYPPVVDTILGSNLPDSGSPLCTPVDYALAEYLQLVGCPDIFLFSSKLKSFVMCVEDVLCINPRSFQASKCVAHLTAHACSSQNSSNSWKDRVRVDILRISSEYPSSSPSLSTQ